MKLRQQFTWGLMFAIAVACGSDHAQSAQDGGYDPPDEPARLLSDMVGWDIVLKDQKYVGQIADFVIGARGNVMYAIGSASEDDDQNYLIPFGALSIGRDRESVRLDITIDDFYRLEFFEGREVPNIYAPEFRREMREIFGANVFRPGVARGAARGTARSVENPAPAVEPPVRIRAPEGAAGTNDLPIPATGPKTPSGTPNNEVRTRPKPRTEVPPPSTTPGSGAGLPGAPPG